MTDVNTSALSSHVKAYSYQSNEQDRCCHDNNILFKW